MYWSCPCATLLASCSDGGTTIDVHVCAAAGGDDPVRGLGAVWRSTAKTVFAAAIFAVAILTVATFAARCLLLAIVVVGEVARVRWRNRFGDIEATRGLGGRVLTVLSSIFGDLLTYACGGYLGQMVVHPRTRRWLHHRLDLFLGGCLHLILQDARHHGGKYQPDALIADRGADELPDESL